MQLPPPPRYEQTHKYTIAAYTGCPFPRNAPCLASCLTWYVPGLMPDMVCAWPHAMCVLASCLTWCVLGTTDTQTHIRAHQQSSTLTVRCHFERHTATFSPFPQLQGIFDGHGNNPHACNGKWKIEDRSSCLRLG